MVCLLVLLIACGSPPADKPLTSQPAEPTEDLTGELPSKTQWSDMEGFFPPKPGLPLGAPGLAPGMDFEAGRKALEPLSLGRMVSQEVDGRLAVTITLKEPPDVALAMISDPSQKTVSELQFTVPASQAERVLIDAWGIPAGFTLEEEPSYLWADENLQIEWIAIAGKSAGILTYSQSSAVPPASTP